MAKRNPPPGSEPQAGLAHEPEREGGQPYGKEVHDYSGGVAIPPTEQVTPNASQKTDKPRRSPN
jgi:hypothetical protein